MNLHVQVSTLSAHQLRVNVSTTHHHQVCFTMHTIITKEHPPWSELCVANKEELEKYSLKCMSDRGNKLSVILH